MKDYDLEAFVSDFYKVKSLGFVKSHRKNNTGIGKTYEDLLGVAENNYKEPDLHGFEIKSQRAYSGSYVTLFTKSPTMPVKANSHLRENYGSYDLQHPDIKVLHTSIFATNFNSHKSGFKFKLNINNKDERLELYVSNENNEIIDKNTYWSFNILEECLVNKLSRLAYVSAVTRRIGDEEEFFFNKANIFSGLKPFSTFLELLNNGIIMFDIRIGAYKTGAKRGLSHDHGSGFRIKKTDMYKLYEHKVSI